MTVSLCIVYILLIHYHCIPNLTLPSKNRLPSQDHLLNHVPGRSLLVQMKLSQAHPKLQ